MNSVQHRKKENRKKGVMIKGNDFLVVGSASSGKRMAVNGTIFIGLSPTLPVQALYRNKQLQPHYSRAREKKSSPHKEMVY